MGAQLLARATSKERKTSNAPILQVTRKMDKK
jgi:hypothetical protein